MVQLWGYTCQKEQNTMLVTFHWMGPGPGFVQTTSVFSSIIGVLSSTATLEPVQAASKQRVHDLYIAAKQGFESWHASGVYMLISLLSCLSKLQNGAMMILLI